MVCNLVNAKVVFTPSFFIHANMITRSAREYVPALTEENSLSTRVGSKQNMP